MPVLLKSNLFFLSDPICLSLVDSLTKLNDFTFLLEIKYRPWNLLDLYFKLLPGLYIFYCDLKNISLYQFNQVVDGNDD